MTECCVIVYRMPSGRIHYGTPLSASCSDRLVASPVIGLARPVYRIRIKAKP